MAVHSPYNHAPPLTQEINGQKPTLAPAITLERPADCINRGQYPAFYIICGYLNRLRADAPHKKYELLMRIFGNWREKVGPDLYPLIRLLLPDRDRERPVYNLKESMLARCYIDILSLEKHSEAAQRLIKWKQPAGDSSNPTGDFAKVCYNEIKARSTVEEGQLSVEAVNMLLDKLAVGKMKQQDYVPILKAINMQCTAEEQEWIIRIILKDLHISIRERGVLSAFHPDAIDLYNVCSDLKRVCWTLYDPGFRLNKNETHLELFHSFLPQLCGRMNDATLENIAKAIGAPKEFIMEEKLDGERIQLHMRGNGAQWFYCSRKAKDYTYLYGAHPGEGSLTRYIATAFQDNVRNVILDGEMMVWDPVVERYLAFGTLKSAALDHFNDETAPRPCFKVFDILFLNDHCLSRKRLSERKRLLRSGKIFKDIENYKGRLEFVDEKRGKSAKDIRDYLERVVETKGEGLVVKKTDVIYQTNSRGYDWIKVKPEYSDQMGENLEVLVLGGWWGKGGRSGKISRLLCGLREQAFDDGTVEKPSFKTFCSIGSGMSYSDYEWILNKHKMHWKPFDRSNPPPFMKLGSVGLDDKPDVYIEPENSFVIEVKAAEIVPAGGYGIGFTLRFPRCKYIYYDKNSRDYALDDESKERDMWTSMSVDDFLDLFSRPKRSYDDSQGPSRKKKKRKVVRSKKNRLISNFRGQKLSDADVETSIFSDMTFYIAKGTSDYPKADLEALVHKHGADFTQAQLSDLSAIVISPDQKNPLVRAQIRHGVNVIKPEWIFESIARRTALPLLKEFLVFASEEAQDGRYYNKTLEQYDKVSFVRDRTGEALFEEDDDADVEDEVMDGEDKDEIEVEEARVSKDRRMAREDLKEKESNRTLEQKKLQEAWGLRSGASTGDSDTEPEEEMSLKEESDTDSERSRGLRAIYEDERDEENDSHESDVGVNGDDYRAVPLSGLNDKEERLMGESPEAMHYDEDRIFYHLAFYIDTAKNAAINGLKSSSPSFDTQERLAKVEKLLIENGGRMAKSISDLKLTHIIMDEEDSGRYVELTRKTALPKRKHIVTPKWVEDCLDEETLLDEDLYKPK
ncbi:DNA ligase 4 [Cryptococcus neoformans]|nr:DNA ligase 4 [Cryptococcus neoformans var. grubii]